MQLKESGQISLRINKKKFIYLISPNKIQRNFYKNLDEILQSKKVKFFQLRIKNSPIKKIIDIGKKVKKICKKNKVIFIINDDPNIAKLINCDGCHLGQSDTDILKARKIIKNKIIGLTCHNSKKLVKKAVQNKADYIALGAFYPTKTKKTRFRARLKLISDTKKLTDVPIVAIGGINSKNYKNLLLHKANFLAISGYIWNNKKLTPKEAISLLNYEN